MSSQHSHADKHRRSKASSAKQGFFIALALCLIAVGGVAAVTFSESSKPPLVTPLDDITTTNTAVTPSTTAKADTVNVIPATTVTTTATTEATQSSSLFVLPLSNVVLTPFSDHPIYSETMDDYRVHKGTDFDGEEGQPVRALADGTVTAVEDDPLWGPSISIDHGDGILSVYRGIAATVTPDQTLAVGDTIGSVAAIPCESTLGPHLHLELYRNGQAIDPATLLSGQLTTLTE